MSTPSLYEMLTFSFSGELPLEQVSERDQLILSVMDNMQRIINCRAGTLAHLPDYGLPDLSLIHQGMVAGIHGLMRQIEETLLRYEPRLSQIQVELSDRFGTKNGGVRHPAVVKGAAAGRTASATGRAKTDRRGFADAVDAN